MFGPLPQGHGGAAPSPGPHGAPHPAGTRLFAQERETVEEAFPGDVVGLINPGLFAIGDTLCEGEPVQFAPMPRFAPECFARLENRSSGRHKQFHAGLEQLEEEGAIQVLYAVDGARQPILAAVGELQLDVTAARLRDEYGVDAAVERLGYESACWVDGVSDGGKSITWPTREVLRTEDREGRPGRALWLRLGAPLRPGAEPGRDLPGAGVSRGTNGGRGDRRDLDVDHRG